MGNGSGAHEMNSDELGVQKHVCRGIAVILDKPEPREVVLLRRTRQIDPIMCTEKRLQSSLAVVEWVCDMRTLTASPLS